MSNQSTHDAGDTIEVTLDEAIVKLQAIRAISRRGGATPLAFYSESAGRKELVGDFTYVADPDGSFVMIQGL